MEGHASSIIYISLGAFLLPILAGRLKLPPMVVEIVFGILLGPELLNLIQHSEAVDFLSELGLLLLMFLSGFEIDFGRLQRQGAGQLVTGLAVFLATLAAAYLAGQRLGYGPFFTLLLATTSVGLVVPTLRATRQSGTRLGQVILISALMADFLTLIAVAVYAMVIEHGMGPGLLKFPLLFVAIAITLYALKRLAWWYPERFEPLFEATQIEEMGIRASLALMFVFVGLSQVLGVEPILGAFLAGTCFAFVFRHRGELEHKLSGFAFGFLVPIFFIQVGTRFELGHLTRPGVLQGALTLIAAAFAVKLTASLALFAWGFSLREVLGAGVLLSARLSLVIAVARLGTELGLLDAVLESEVVLLAVVTAIVSPSLFRALLRPRAPQAQVGRAPAGIAPE